jgi:hypothetical protein
MILRSDGRSAPVPPFGTARPVDVWQRSLRRESYLSVVGRSAAATSYRSGLLEGPRGAATRRGNQCARSTARRARHHFCVTSRQFFVEASGPRPPRPARTCAAVALAKDIATIRSIFARQIKRLCHQRWISEKALKRTLSSRFYVASAPRYSYSWTLLCFLKRLRTGASHKFESPAPLTCIQPWRSLACTSLTPPVLISAAFVPLPSLEPLHGPDRKVVPISWQHRF